MKYNVTVNGKKYEAKEFDFNFICDLEVKLKLALLNTVLAFTSLIVEQLFNRL